MKDGGSKVDYQAFMDSKYNFKMINRTEKDI